jgi:hypothetical protein
MAKPEPPKEKVRPNNSLLMTLAEALALRRPDKNEGRKISTELVTL